jgi:preprotein translocase subunit SecG
MTIIFVILIILASFILGLIVLIQNPKGGGLSGTFGGFSTQFMGVKQTTDVLEKGTWIFASVIAVLCLLSAFFLNGGSGSGVPDSNVRDAAVPTSGQQPAQPGTGIPSTPPPNPNAVPFDAGR